MIFLSHELSRRMKQQLDSENRDLNTFIQSICVEYLNKIENEKTATKNYVSFNDMLQLSCDNKYDWYYNEEDIAERAVKDKK